METTRHFVATVYVVNEGAIALHHHDKLDMWLPPGGHLHRDELPHEAARREVREEIGQGVDLLATSGDVSSETVRELPHPRQFLLEDIDYVEDEVAHQHVDFVFYGTVGDRSIDPDDGEQPPADWEWVTAGTLRNESDRFEPDVIEFGQDAIRTVEARSER
ncbi:MAG: 8-oxo-dGTP pyrophosphatase MutT (NUDIX family) [Halobacteriales archaeon]|jgi:8-oxo-dGTP pyrophosphatase MutT (NUDIX family)